MTSPLEIDPDATVWNAPPGERDARPLLIVMHGRRSNETDLAPIFPEFPDAFVCAALRAPIQEEPGWSWFEDGGGNLRGDPTPANADRAADAVLTWIDGLDWTPSSIGTLGFSQGGAVATHLLRHAPDRIAFAVNLAGFLVRGEQPGDATLTIERPPVFWGRGADDELFTPDLVERTGPWLAMHTTLDLRVYPGLGHSVSPEELSDVTAFLAARAL